jgi:hypothetical protein
MNINLFIFIFSMFKNTNLFTILTKFLVIILPFYVFIKVFFEFKLQIPYFWIFIKEFVIILLLISLFYSKIKEKIKFSFDILDYLIFAYFSYWIIISLYNWLWFNSLFFWGRYDFLFLIVFQIYKHSEKILKISLDKLLILFLKSSLLSLLIWILIKFWLKEEFLLHFWYINYVSNWQFDWWIPIYHWLDASWLRRFQWIMESPNSMAFFIIIVIWSLLHKFRKKIEYHIVLLVIILISLIIITYSRSALLWIISASSLLIIMNIKSIYKKYKKETIISILILLLTTAWLLFLFQEKIHNIFLRDWSTKGHFERMEIWINRFKENLLWQWLGTSWPAYRKIYSKEEISKQVEAYYIPESWFIQQLIEWWIIYFTLFTLIILNILIKTYKKSYPLFWAFLAIIIMNIFLHSFESTYNSLLLFMFLWIILKNKVENK